MKKIRYLVKGEFCQMMREAFREGDNPRQLKYLDTFLNELSEKDVVQCVTKQRLLLSVCIGYPIICLFNEEPSFIRVEEYALARYGGHPDPEPKYTITTRDKRVLIRPFFTSGIYDRLIEERLFTHDKNMTLTKRWKDGKRTDIETVVRKSDGL